MGREIKMGFVLLLQVRKSGRRFYLVLPGPLCGDYRLQPGDNIRVELKTLTRKGEEDWAADEQ